MAESARYVAVVERDAKIAGTYVFEGTTMLDAIFEFINERRFLNPEVTGISIHLDQSASPTWVEKVAQHIHGSAEQQ